MKYYVTVRDASHVGFLLGPYSDHEAAKADVKWARKLAVEAVTRAWFYEYGTASIEDAAFTPRVVFTGAA